MLIHPTSLLLCVLFLSLPAHAAITAKVDQQTIHQGEKLTLTIETDQTHTERPDLRSLQTDYVILSTKHVTFSSHSTNNVIIKNRWILSLRPINHGEKKIPSMKIGTEKSPEISLSVLPTKQNQYFNEDVFPPIYLESEFNKENVYINGQAILTTRIFHLSPLSLNTHLTQPESINAIIKPLEEKKQYTTLVQGQSYTVTENSYAIFPRQEGPLEIGPQFLDTTLTNELSVELNTPKRHLFVLPRAYTGDAWLPAENIDLEDNLFEDYQATVNEPFTRIITIKAEGLPASALPSLSTLNNELAEVRLLNVALEEQMTEQGVTSKRTEELLITPMTVGNITLPEINTPWWNTKTNQILSLHLPLRTIRVTTPANKITENLNSTSSIKPAFITNLPNILIWFLTSISLISTIGFIYSFNKLRLLKNEYLNAEAQQAQEKTMRQQTAIEIAERNTFQALSMACNQNNPRAAQLRLIEWAQSFWDNPQLLSLKQVCKSANNQTFNFLILDLEQYLYSENSELWRGDLLLETIEKLRERHIRSQ